MKNTTATTTISLSDKALTVGRALAKNQNRSFSGQVQHLIIEEAARRGLIKTAKKSA